MPQSGNEGNTGQTDGAQDGQQDQNDGTGTDSAQGTGNGGQSNGGSDSASNQDQNTGNNETVSRADFDRLKAQLSAADQNREKAERELKTLKDKDLSELEKAQSDLTDVTKERDGLVEKVQKLLLQNAFLSANEVTWQNADAALTLAQSQGYLDGVVDEKGDVDKSGLKKALKKLSEDHKYLVKSKDDDGDGGDDDKQGSTGAPAGGRNNNTNDEKARSERLKTRMPALGRR